MQVADNTILVTGGTSGIGRALAEAFHRLGNRVVVAGRRQALLDEVVAANPGMASLAMDVGDRAGVAAFADRLLREHPTLNVVVNNAGIMQPEDLDGALDDMLDIAERTIATNLLGPIRLTACLLPHLKRQPRAAVLTVSSGLAFVPMAATPTYCATKAAIHSWSVSLRHRLAGGPVEVIEIVPPYVQTELLGAHQASDPNAMPLGDFIDEVMEILARQPEAGEVVVGRCAPLRFAARNGNETQMFERVNAAPH